MALFLAFLFTSYSNSQTVDPLTGNLITGSWQGTTPASGYNGYSGGYMPGYISNQKAIVFGYSQGTASQSIGIANALANAGTGIEVKGYNYSWYYYNNDANRGSLTGNISLTSPTGSVLESHSYNMPQTGIGNWIQQSGSQLFANQYQINQVSALNVSFTGKDDRFWAGYYGPAIKAIDVRLMYGVDPCATNPAYSPSCAGFDKVLTSSNLVPNPDAYAYGGYSINQSYAINTALASAGSGAMIHGFKWGYVANANGPYCAIWFLTCFDERYPAVDTSVSITNSAGATLYSANRHYENSYNTTNYSYLFPTSQVMSSLGNFNFTATTNDQQSYIGSMWSRAVYTVDPCVANPLYSPSCSGYAAAFAKTLQSPTTTTSSTTYAGTTNVTSGSLVETSPAGVIDQTNPTTTQQTSSTTSTSSNSSTPTTQDTAQTTTVVATADPAQPASTTPTPVGGPVQTTTNSSSSSSSSSSSGGGSGPSKLAMSVLKTAQANDKATQQMAVQNAAKVVEGSTQQSQATVTSTIASLTEMSSTSASAAAQFASQTTQASMQVAIQSNQSQQSQQSTTQSFQNIQAIQSSTQSNQYSSGTGITINNNSFGFNSNNIGLSLNTNQQPQTVSMYQPKITIRQTEVELPTQVSTFSGTSRPGNPLSEIMMQQQFEMMQSNIEQRGPSVNRNVQPNDLANGVDVASMAIQPKGFELYSFTIRDTTFYPPKEVYKDQKVIDNVMVLRQLSSDRLHQELVNLQYK